MRALTLFVLCAVSTQYVATDTNSEDTQKGAPNLVDNLQNIRKIMSEILKSRSMRTAEDQQDKAGNRKQKSFGGFPYYPELLNYPLDMGYYFPQGKTPLNQEWRTEPFKRKPTQQLLDSPIYYVRLPASPYVFVPGVGYISRPPQLNAPGVLDALTEPKPTEIPNSDSNFIHVPIDFVSNGKPTNVYQLPNDPIIKPKPDSGFYGLDKGPYLFNGKPIELYVLRNSYNQLYADALTNFYP